MEILDFLPAANIKKRFCLFVDVLNRIKQKTSRKKWTPPPPVPLRSLYFQLVLKIAKLIHIDRSTYFIVIIQTSHK